MRQVPAQEATCPAKHTASSFSLEALLPAAHEAAELLRAAGATVAVAESSSGGLVAAALLAVPGASAYFRGGGVVYTGDAKALLLDETPARLTDPRAATPPMPWCSPPPCAAGWMLPGASAKPVPPAQPATATVIPPGHSCVAVVGPAGQQATTTVATGESDRAANMTAFALAALQLLAQAAAAA